MTTLIEVRKLDGRLIGRCDAKCYNAKRQKCSCICGGRNHGAGLIGALQMTRDHASIILTEQSGNEVEFKPVQLEIDYKSKAQ